MRYSSPNKQKSGCEIRTGFTIQKGLNASRELSHGVIQLALIQDPYRLISLLPDSALGMVVFYDSSSESPKACISASKSFKTVYMNHFNGQIKVTLFVHGLTDLEVYIVITIYMSSEKAFPLTEIMNDVRHAERTRGTTVLSTQGA